MNRLGGRRGWIMPLGQLEHARWVEFVEHYSSCDVCFLRPSDLSIDDLCEVGRRLFGTWMLIRARVLKQRSPVARVDRALQLLYEAETKGSLDAP